MKPIKFKDIVKDIDKNSIKIIILFFILIIILTIAIRIVFFYQGIYLTPKQYIHDLDVSIESVTPEFVDIFEKTRGTVLFDLAHENNFDEEEIDVLVSRIVDRSNKIEFLIDADNLDAKLRKANAFVVILPRKEYSEKEINLVKEFVDKKGKLLLISDPDRENEINSIANDFNIIFSNDYLYNQKENDGNFKYIFLKDFKKSSITKKLNKIALYASCPILPFENGIVITDKNTFSSSEKIKTGFAPIVFKNPVLALCDITFFDQPYNIVVNNNQLVSNIADYLTTSEKEFSLIDYPYFFEGNVTVVTTNLDLSKHAVNLKNRLIKADINVDMSRTLNRNIDSVAIELFDDFGATTIENLAVDGNSFRINDLLFNRKGSSLVRLAKNNVTILTILADNEEILEKTLDLLDKEEIRDNLVDDNLAVISGLEVKGEGKEEETEEE